MEKKILEYQWLKKIDNRISILDEASLTLVREKIRDVAHASGLSALAERACLVATELAHNQLHHAKFGEMVIQKIIQAGVPGLEIIAADQGEGILNPAAALRGEISTTGSLGAGLSSVYELSDQLDFDIRLGIGTCLWSRIFEKNSISIRPELGCELAIMGRSYPGERISGDSAFFCRRENDIILSIADGLGHGLLAHEASFKAIQFIEQSFQQPLESLDSLVIESNEHLADTRGAALGLVHLDITKFEMEHLGVGDIGTHLNNFEQYKKFITMPHFLGSRFGSKSFRQERCQLSPGMVLIMFSDGLKTDTSLKDELEIMRRPAVAIAQWLLEQYGRSNDDATVLVAKFKHSYSCGRGSSK